MRTTPILGDKLWFGPRGWGGWGWTPVSWEGWAVVAVFTAVAVGTGALLDDGAAITPIFLEVVALIAVCWLKGTSPGGPGARRLMEIQREREEDDRRR